MGIVPQSLWLRFEASGASDPSSEGGEHALGISWIDDMASHARRLLGWRVADCCGGLFAMVVGGRFENAQRGEKRKNAQKQ